MRVMALDVGTVRIGVALSDEDRLFASPLETIPARPSKDAVARIKVLIETHAVTQLVIGQPLDLDGEAGRAARRNDRFVQRLQKRVDVPIDLWDERLSSVAAERALLEGNVRRADRKEKVDMVAAAIILQGYLDAQERDS